MPNWPPPNPEIQHLLRKLSNGSVGHPLGSLWQAFDPIKTDDKKPKAHCIFSYLINAHNCQQKLVPIIERNQHQDNSYSSDGSIVPFMSVSNCDSVSTFSDNNMSENNNVFKNTSQIPTQLPIDVCRSNRLLLEGIIEGRAPLSLYHVPARKQLFTNILNDVYKNVQTSIQQFINMSNWITIMMDGWTNIQQDYLVNFIAIGKDRRSELIKIKDTLGESQTLITIFKDLEEVLMQIGIKRINAVITDSAASYVHMKIILVQQYPKIIVLPCIAYESNLLFGDMLKHIYMKSIISSAVKIIAQTQINTNMINDKDFQLYVNTLLEVYTQNIKDDSTGAYTLVSNKRSLEQTNTEKNHYKRVKTHLKRPEVRSKEIYNYTKTEIPREKSSFTEAVFSTHKSESTLFTNDLSSNTSSRIQGREENSTGNSLESSRKILETGSNDDISDN
ncbi:188_t:CDS:2 [Scutellospora calospora]|uniref:188_t:CDS:1 n=1 Tax=Scutellospora calospora TaxID=85575 RepID=A0ACA9JVF8_9GLOM|nr:188_t:CDS:2 [Scutellospora calospora]